MNPTTHVGARYGDSGDSVPKQGHQHWGPIPPRSGRWERFIKDPNGHESILLKDWWSCVSPSPSGGLLAVADKLRATFVLRKAHIDGLKAQILSQLKNNDLDSESDPTHLSTFAATSAFIWVYINKSKEEEHQHHEQSSSSDRGDYKLCYFVFVEDCRDQLEYSIPSIYFGNCLNACFLSEKRNTLLGKSEISRAARAIGRKVKEVGTGGAWRAMERWLRDFRIANDGDLVTVAGSSRHKVYNTDFGWGGRGRATWCTSMYRGRSLSQKAGMGMVVWRSGWH
ncbi:hypothetical protein NL676_000778 [Syzygium grande]|nr:hypothetical protein NL676_000778 [Syzygium grande]